MKKNVNEIKSYDTCLTSKCDFKNDLAVNNAACLEVKSINYKEQK